MISHAKQQEQKPKGKSQIGHDQLLTGSPLPNLYACHCQLTLVRAMIFGMTKVCAITYTTGFHIRISQSDAMPAGSGIVVFA
jgi:hypothetical protein